MRRKAHCIGRRAMEMKVKGLQEEKRVRPKRRWLDSVMDDIKERIWSGEEVLDLANWK